MIRKIESHQLRQGMFIHKLGVSWMKHPFLTSSFLIKDAKDIDTIVSERIEEVWIDTGKGLDIESATEDAAAPASNEAGPAETAETTEAEPEAAAPECEAETPERAGETPQPAPAEAAPQAAVAAEAKFLRIPGGEKTSMRAEVENAKKLCDQAKSEMVGMFNDARMGKAVKIGDAMPLVEEISASVMRHDNALISVARIKTHDTYTYMHSVAVCALMIALARRLKLDEAQVRDAAIGGLMHDLGKAMMPLEVLNKPGKLTDEEFAIMKSHPKAGWNLLKEGGEASQATLDIALHHHEKYDGNGYPKRLKGDEISLLSRMGAVCDVYDAVTSDRPYKKGWDPAESIRQMATWKGHFDEKIFQAFVRSVGIYPVGALVRTKRDKLAVIIEQNPTSLLTPKILVFHCAKTRTPVEQHTVDLSSPDCREALAGIEDPSAWGFENLERLWMA